MSMNLNASTKDGVIELWQTPTQISYVILPPALGLEVTGKAAREALIRYAEWVKYSVNGMYPSAEAATQARIFADEHARHVLQFVGRRSLRVWVQ